MFFLKEIQKQLKIKLKFSFLKMQPGDIQKSKSDQSKLYTKIKYKPQTSINKGIGSFLNWYFKYFKVK